MFVNYGHLKAQIMFKQIGNMPNFWRLPPSHGFNLENGKPSNQLSTIAV